jgi:hypothetical protein
MNLQNIKEVISSLHHELGDCEIVLRVNPETYKALELAATTEKEETYTKYFKETKLKTKIILEEL